MPNIIYFSPSGNVKHLAKILADKLLVPSEEVLPLEFTDPAQLDSCEHLILLFPIHGFNAPRTVKRFVRNIPQGRFEFISLVAVGCSTSWVNSAVSAELKKTLTKKGIETIVDEVMAMPLTFIMNFPDEMNRKLISDAEKRIDILSLALKDKITSIRKIRKRSYVINFLGRGESPAARLFGLELHANKNCTSCGTCWTNCPEKNIKEKKNGKPGFGFSCSMCMRCIYSCPEIAISPHISKFIPIKGGYSLSKYITKTQ